MRELFQENIVRGRYDSRKWLISSSDSIGVILECEKKNLLSPDETLLVCCSLYKNSDLNHAEIVGFHFAEVYCVSQSSEPSQLHRHSHMFTPHLWPFSTQRFVFDEVKIFLQSVELLFWNIDWC